MAYEFKDGLPFVYFIEELWFRGYENTNKQRLNCNDKIINIKKDCEKYKKNYNNKSTVNF